MTEIVRLTQVMPGMADDFSALATQLHEKPSVVTDADIAAVLAEPQTALFVAQDGTRVVGMATLCVSQKLGKAVARVEDVVVSTDYRGQGLGEKLMHALIDEARARGARSLELTSRPSRVAAHKLYEKLGFKTRETDVFKLDLS